MEFGLLFTLLEIASDNVIARPRHLASWNHILTLRITNGILLQIISPVQRWISWLIRMRSHISRILHLLQVIIVSLRGITWLYYLETWNRMNWVLLVSSRARVTVIR